MKHATLFHLSKWPRELALRHADQQYQGANIDLKIQEHLTTTSQEQSVILFEDFIMATDIGLFIPASTILSKYLIKLCRIYAPDILVDLSLFLPARTRSSVMEWSQNSYYMSMTDISK